MNFLKILNIIFLSLLTINLSCKGQNIVENTGKATNNKAISIGTPVSKMDDSLVVIFQDTHDNYWFGSKTRGVYKYATKGLDSLEDKKRLTHFTIKDGLCNNSILGIQEDKFGNVYFDTPTGVSKFDGQQFTTLEVFDGYIFNKEWTLKPDDLWFRMGSDKSGPYRYDGKLLYALTFPKSSQEKVFYEKYPNVSYNPYGIYTLYKDRRGHIWFGTASLGLCRYDGQSISWLYESHLSEIPNGGDFGIRSIIEDKAGHFWFCNTRYRYNILPTGTEQNGTSLLNYTKENGIGTSSQDKGQAFPYFMSIAETDNGDLWMLTYSDGVWRNNGKELLHYPIQEEDKTVFLFSIYKDRQGVLWLGTHNAGAYTYNGERFVKFEP